MTKKIVIASGKGGVGKSMLTSVLVCLAAADGKVVAVDADVDAPNLYLWLGQDESWAKEEPVSVSQKPRIDMAKCDGCGKCVEFCLFDALELKAGKPVLRPFFCEGCGACEEICPQGAINLKPVDGGVVKEREVILGEVRFPLVSAQLFPGEVGSGKIVDIIKEKAAGYAGETVWIDAPAGTGCPVIAAFNGADFAVLVAEPTPAAEADMKRALAVAKHFGIDYGVVINKWDLNKHRSRQLRARGKDRFLGQISYDRRLIEAIANLKPVIETDLPAKDEIRKIYARIKSRLILK